MKKISRMALTVFAASGLAFSASAHHSFPAQYDASKQVTLTGAVTKIEWTNPHIFIYIDVQDEETHETINWALEMGAPNALLRLGWKRDSLKPGNVITIEGSLARDGSNLANAKSIVLTATGQRMLAGSSQETSGADDR